LDNENVEPLNKGAVSRGRVVCQLLNKATDVVGYINEEIRGNVKGGGVEIKGVYKRLKYKKKGVILLSRHQIGTRENNFNISIQIEIKRLLER